MLGMYRDTWGYHKDEQGPGLREIYGPFLRVKFVMFWGLHGVPPLLCMETTILPMVPVRIGDPTAICKALCLVLEAGLFQVHPRISSYQVGTVPPPPYSKAHTRLV